MVTYTVVRTQSEIDNVLNRCTELQDSDENPYWGQSYVDGVEAGIRWLTEKTVEEPLETQVAPQQKGR